MISRMPYCPNKLSPWPRVVFSYGKAEKDAHRRVEAERSDNFIRPALRLAEPTNTPNNNAFSKNGLSPCRRTSFGSTQQYQTIKESAPSMPLDREKSGQEVHRLLNLRKKKLEEAQRSGDHEELYRLKHLNVFDEIGRLNADDGRSHEVQELAEALGVQYEVGSRASAAISGFIPRSPVSVNQFHTGELCWHMRLQHTHGALIPEEFTDCTIHHAPVSSANTSSLSSHVVTNSPQSSVSSVTGDSPLRKAKSSTSCSTNAHASSVTCSPSSVSAASSEFEEKDPFLYIAKYILYQSARKFQGKKTHQATSAMSAPGMGKQNLSHCTCTNHKCRVYLSGVPTEHCNGCRLPLPQPEIQAAMSRIQDFGHTVALADYDRTEIDQFERLQEDLEFVDTYDAEMEKRCYGGVWWEGWLIVEELKRKGIVGSKPNEGMRV